MTLTDTSFLPLPYDHPAPLAADLRQALTDPDDAALERLGGRGPSSRRDRFLTLLQIYELASAPVQRLGRTAWCLGHPGIARLKQHCEQVWLAELDALHPLVTVDATDALTAMRALAARDRLTDIYRWIGRVASRAQVEHFLALEGGPDAGFDDLVAACQIGLRGRAKLELATNYWDEMGNGDLASVHTTLHDSLVEAIGLESLAPEELPTSALERLALGGLLSTNRGLQPEALGALGLIELQAGPRCRLIVQAFDRCRMPAAAYPFYEVHAEVDPRHGRDWLDNAIAPTIAETPEWATRIVTGALWRSSVNAAFLRDVEELVK